MSEVREALASIQSDHSWAYDTLTDEIKRLTRDGERLREVVQAYHETARQFVQKARELSRIVKDAGEEPS